LEILKKLPYSSKNLVTDLKLEDVIKPLCDSPEKNIASLSKEVNHFFFFFFFLLDILINND